MGDWQTFFIWFNQNSEKTVIYLCSQEVLPFMSCLPSNIQNCKQTWMRHNAPVKHFKILLSSLTNHICASQWLMVQKAYKKVTLFFLLLLDPNFNLQMFLGPVQKRTPDLKWLAFRSSFYRTWKEKLQRVIQSSYSEAFTGNCSLRSKL